MSQLLKNKKIRVTEFRLEVLSLFKKNKHALSLHTIEKNLISFDRITLYRTLKTFVNKGVLHEVVIPNDDKKYALCNEGCTSEKHEHQHIHFKCVTCEEVYCKELNEFPEVTIKGFMINQIELNATGYCSNCL